MIFSKSCEYALRAVLYTYMKSDSNANLGVKEIAKEIGSPVPFTAKILQQLTKKKIISSVKGPNGGFYIDPSSKPVSIYQVVEAIDGTDFFERTVVTTSNGGALVYSFLPESGPSYLPYEELDMMKRVLSFWRIQVSEAPVGD